MSSPSLTGGSHQIAVIAKIPSLRGVSETNDEAISFKIPSKIPCVIAREQSNQSNLIKSPSLRGRILDFSGVLGAAAPKGLGRSSYKICELG